eukprot:995517-Amphidinium_carterae.1
MELMATVISLQEVLDDSPDLDISSGWWEIQNYKMLVIRTHDTLLMYLLLEKSTPGMLPKYNIRQYSIAVTLEVSGIRTRLVSLYIAPAGHDILDPNMYFKALTDIEQQTEGFTHRILLGDWNAWIGCSRYGHIGPYHLSR